MEQSLPAVSNGALQLTLQTYNPTGAGDSFLGSEIISDQTFNDTAGGIAFTAVARLDTTVPGMVGGIFAYNYNDSTDLDNELDFESLTNEATGQNNQEQTNVYGNQPLGAGNPEFVSIPGLNLTDYNTYTMEWFPTEVLWFIDGQLVRESTDDVPQGPMAFHLNFWAPDTMWADAYSASLQPTSNLQDNTTYTFEIQSITVAEISCYAAGTRIATQRGELPVEALRAGARVRVLLGRSDGTVLWVGHRRVDCRRHPKPQDVWPVRVAAGAFGANQPRRDLWLSPDHAVCFGGVLIPIRYLINDATIVQEPMDAVTYWHVELPEHDVLLAEGMPAESYLDTGNRGAFANGDGPTMLHPDFALGVWEAKACAKLVRAGAELVAIRNVLFDCAAAVGHVRTRDSGLHVVATGCVVRPETTGRVHRFRLGRMACAVRLVSRSAVPASVRADNDDHRRLGVAVSRIVLDGRTIPLGDARLGSGWHALEADGAGGFWRWTDGDAALDVAGASVLEVEVAMTERYWLNGSRANARAA
jgi:hypothetical protein